MDKIPQQPTQSYKAQLDKLLYWTAGITLFIGIITLVAIIRFPANEIPENTSIFYWFYPNVDYLVVPQLCIPPILIILIIRFLLKNTVLTMISAFILFGVAVYHAYLLLILVFFVLTGVGHIDSVKFRDKTHHLAGEYTFDDFTYKTVLCEYDSKGYWCKCHHLGEVGNSEKLWLDVDSSTNWVNIRSSKDGQVIHSYHIFSP